MGVRRYQNPDGSLTERGRKRLYGSSDKVESFGRRRNRAAEAAYQKNLSSIYKNKASKTSSDKRRAKYTDLSNKASTNAKLYAKGLSKEEKEFGKHYNIANNATTKSSAFGYLFGGVPGALGASAGVAVGSNLFNKSYRESRDAAKKAYEKYKTQKTAEITDKKQNYQYSKDGFNNAKKAHEQYVKKHGKDFPDALYEAQKKYGVDKVKKDVQTHRDLTRKLNDYDKNWESYADKDPNFWDKQQRLQDRKDRLESRYSESFNDYGWNDD